MGHYDDLEAWGQLAADLAPLSPATRLERIWAMVDDGTLSRARAEWLLSVLSRTDQVSQALSEIDRAA